MKVNNVFLHFFLETPLEREMVYGYYLYVQMCTWRQEGTHGALATCAQLNLPGWPKCKGLSDSDSWLSTVPYEKKQRFLTLCSLFTVMTFGRARSSLAYVACLDAADSSDAETMAAIAEVRALATSSKECVEEMTLDWSQCGCDDCGGLLGDVSTCLLSPCWTVELSCD